MEKQRIGFIGLGNMGLGMAPARRVRLRDRGLQPHGRRRTQPPS